MLHTHEKKEFFVKHYLSSFLLIFFSLCVQASDHTIRSYNHANQQKPNAIIVIGASGTGRSSFADVITKQLKQQGSSVKRMSVEDIFRTDKYTAYKETIDEKRQGKETKYDASAILTKHYLQIAYQVLKPFHDTLQEKLAKKRDSVFVIDYIADSMESRKDFTKIITNYSNPLVIKLFCDKKIALSRYDQTSGERRTVEKHYANPVIYEYGNLSAHFTVETTYLTLSDYDQEAKKIIDYMRLLSLKENR